MLAQRVATALVLLALWLPTLWMHSPWPFMVLTLILISAAAWEWARLNGLASGGAWASGVAVAAAGLLAASALSAIDDTPALWWLAACVWIIGGALVLRAGPLRWSTLPQAIRVGLGLALLAVAWWALAQARIFGVNYLLSVLCVVWMADIAAYFGGRASGAPRRHRPSNPVRSGRGDQRLLGACCCRGVDRLRCPRSHRLGEFSRC
jgi:phosphatidate cytidylyltransferase